MTLTREPVPSREQVIAWVESQIAGCAAVGPKGLFSSHLVVQDDGRHFEAILTLLQSAETVAQEKPFTPAWQAEIIRRQTAEAEATRLTQLYNELIMAVASKYRDESRHQTALRYITERETPQDNQSKSELEATPSGPEVQP